MTRTQPFAAAASVLAAALSLGVLGAPAARAQDGVCGNPNGYCARSLNAACVSRLGAGVEPQDVAEDGATPEERTAQAEACRAELNLYRDCLSLVAAQCPSTVGGAPQPGAAPHPKPDPLQVWAEIKNAQAPEPFEAFVKDYPGSALAALAAAKAKALRGGAGKPAEPKTAAAAPTPAKPAEASPARGAAELEAPPPSEAAMIAEAQRQSARLKAQFVEAQGHLQRIGYDPGPADGIWGDRSTEALASFLRDTNNPPSPLLTPEALALLRAAPAGSAPKRAAPPPQPAPAPERRAAPAQRPDPTPERKKQLFAVISAEFRMRNGKRARCSTEKQVPGRALNLPKVSIDCRRDAHVRLETTADGRSTHASASFGVDQVSLSGTSWRYFGRTNYRGRNDLESAVVTVDFVER